MIEVVGVGVGVCRFIIRVYGILLERHILRVLLILEIRLLLTLLVLGFMCPVSWQYLVVVVLALGVGEAALGLRVVVKVRRSGGHDRVRSRVTLSRG